jgi:uncharacterized protein YndB with AHSA1/START domain
MPPTFTATVSLLITAEPAAVWHALVTPELIKQYLFGTNVECDWKAGSQFFFRGEYQGTTYEDKGVILEITPESVLKYTYWSSMSGTPDRPENYVDVMFTLSRVNSGTMLTLHQNGMKSEDARKHSEQNWGTVLEGLKNIVEKA